MVKLKKRYLAIEILHNEAQTTPSGSEEISGQDLYRAIVDQIGTLFGDYGVGNVKTSLQVKVCDEKADIAVVRVPVEGCDMVTASLPFIVLVGTTQCTLNLLYRGASMRTVERFLFHHNLRSLYEKLRQCETPVEKESIQEAIRSFTGSAVAYMKF